MSQAVTELIVRGDGALATLDQFENRMEKAGIATEHSTGAIADFERRMAAARAAIERGNAITTESIARKTAEQRAWERWSSTVDRSSALRIRLEREAAQAAVAAANAVNLGYTTQEKAVLTLIALEQRHAAQLQAVTDQHQRAAVAAQTHAAANDNLAASSMRASSGDGGTLQTANVAAQFQDIGVTAAMGMNPIMIALQQGTQLSAVLNSMQNPLRGLATAFVSIINPVSLLTIGFVALAAAAIQWFMSAKNGAEDAAKALEKHNAFLDKTLAGYDQVRDAAKEALDISLKLPQASVESDTAARQQKAAERAAAALEKVLSLQGQFEAFAGYADAFNVPDDVAAKLQTVSDTINRVTADAALSRVELDELHTTFTDLGNTTADQNIKDIAAEGLALITVARDSAAEVDSLGAALRSLPEHIQIRISMSQEFDTALGNMSDLFIDPRSRFEQARSALKAQYDVAMLNADSYAKMAGAAAEYERVLSSINVAEAEANEKSNARSAKAAAKPTNEWQSANDNFQQRIDQQLLEASLIGQTTGAMERQRAEFELLNQAREAGIAITDPLIAQVNALAEAHANAALQMEGARLALELQNDPLSELQRQMATLDELLKAGAVSWQEYGDAAFRANSSAASSVLGLASGMTGALAQMFQDNKAFAVANAVVSTAEAVMKAMATYGPTPWGFAAAGVAAATGAAQIATIMSAQRGSGSVSNPGGASAAAAVAAPAPQKSQDVNVALYGRSYSRDDVRELLEQIGGALGDGMTLNVKAGG